MSIHTRSIRQRWLIKGTLTLTTPTHLSNGDKAPGVDLPLVMDGYEPERPLLTGASLTGALRNYVNEYLKNYEYRKDERSGKEWWLEKVDKSPTEKLFGAARRDEDGDQSPLIVYDALGTSPTYAIELRDGVRIDPKTRTAYVDEKGSGGKFDLELLAAGTTFDIGFELIITKDNEPYLDEIRQTLAQALYGLQEGQIRLGGRKQRGYGECKVANWQVRQYDLTQKADLEAWLSDGRSWAKPDPKWQRGDDIRPLLGASVSESRLPDSFTIDATLTIDGSLLIRAGFEAENAPDVAHLESYRDGELVPVLSGTSLAGVMRAQALRIARTVSQQEETAENFIRELFGYMPDHKEDDSPKKASRVLVKETAVTNTKKLVQSRVAIDRFTGGALESALFAEQPVFGGQTTLSIVVRPPLKTNETQWQAEKGVLLLVLKDLWTGFLAVGGASSVGRGRLQGISAKIHTNKQKWTLTQAGSSLHIDGDPTVLQSYVDTFVNKMLGGVE